MSTDFTKVTHSCGECGHFYLWSADDIAWQYEASPFMPCGHLWKFLDKLLVIPMEDEIIHTDEHPFCMDLSCPCHNDLDLLNELGSEVEGGLLTSWEAMRTLSGLQI